MRHLPPGLQPPGAPRLGPWGDPCRCGCRIVARSLAVGDHFAVPPGYALRQPGPHGQGILRRGVPSAQVVLGDDAVTAQDPAHGGWPRPGGDDPDRDAPLDRAPDPHKVVPLAVVVKMAAVIARSPFPQPANQVDALVQTLRTAAQ